ncbi:MAG: LuxR C-terminal-related transcriptional regulator [Terriglobales bacterium]
MFASISGNNASAAFHITPHPFPVKSGTRTGTESLIGTLGNPPADTTVPHHLLARFPNLEQITPAAHLSARERRVLDAILSRDSNKEIAHRLGLSERTV